jgi:hypothetical protein
MALISCKEAFTYKTQTNQFFLKVGSSGMEQSQFTYRQFFRFFVVQSPKWNICGDQSTTQISEKF